MVRSWNGFGSKVVERLDVGIGINQYYSDRCIEVALRSSMPSVEIELRVGSLAVGFSGGIFLIENFHYMFPASVETVYITTCGNGFMIIHF